MGRPEFSTPGTSGGGQTIAVNSRPEIVDINVSTTATVSAGTSSKTEIYAPTGSVYEVIVLRFNVGSIGSATTGSHSLNVEIGKGNIAALFGSSSYNTDLATYGNSWKNADLTQHPSDEDAQSNQISSMYATENQPIVLEYANNTDADQTQTRLQKLVVKEMTY